MFKVQSRVEAETSECRKLITRTEKVVPVKNCTEVTVPTCTGKHTGLGNIGFDSLITPCHTRDLKVSVFYSWYVSARPRWMESKALFHKKHCNGPLDIGCAMLGSVVCIIFKVKYSFI